MHVRTPYFEAGSSDRGRSWLPRAGVDLLARALARDMMRVDSKVPLGIAPPPIT